MSTQTATATDVASHDRLGLFSKLRGKLTTRRASRAGEDARPSKNDPYRKARSMDAGRKPFVSQPALAIRNDHGDRLSSEDSDSSPPTHTRARSSFDGGRNGSVFRFPQFGRTPKSPVSPTAQKLPEPARAIDGLPTPTDPASAAAARQPPPRASLLVGNPRTPERPRRNSNRSSVAFADASPATRVHVSPPPAASVHPSGPPQISPVDVDPFTSTSMGNLFDVLTSGPSQSSGSAPFQLAKPLTPTVLSSSKASTSGSLLPPAPKNTTNASPVALSNAPRAINGLPTTADPVLIGKARRSLEIARSSPPKVAAQVSTSSEQSAPSVVEVTTPKVASKNPLVLPPSLSRRGWQTGAHTQSTSESPSSSTAPDLPSTPNRSSTLPLRGTPHLGVMPARPLSRVQLTGGARLSPSITMRQPSMPILTLPPLPPLPPPTPSESARLRPNAAVRLMSMPRLSMVGRSAEEDADHENAMLEEDEDEAGDGSHSDDDGSTEYASARGSVHEDDPAVQRPKISLRPSRVFGASLREGVSTPRPGRIMDYFSAKSPEKDKTPRDAASPLRTPRAADVRARPTPLPAPALRTPALMATPARTPGPVRTVSPRYESARPNLHHVASRSMVDLVSPRMKPDQSIASVMDTTKPPDSSPAPALKRQTSMPTFNVSSPPPPYPAFPPHSSRILVVPREEEGRERLPAYENGLYLRAILSRKMEFAGPGVQAKDRKWRRVLCELQGTVFRVYKCPPGAAGVSSITEWWESKVGVSDLAGESGTGGGLATTGPAAAGRVEASASGRGAQEPERVQKAEENALSATLHTGPTSAPAEAPPIEQRRSRLAAHLLPSRSSRGRHSMDTTRESTPSAEGSSSSRRASMPPSASRLSSRPSVASTTASSSTGSLPKDKDCPEPEAKDILRKYTLQNAESGLGSDYVKRKNVIRVRLEGEQFLLQAPDVAAVVDWIEGFQAATNIALDLDERTMPRPPLFPRRRRRRVRRAESGTAAPAGSNTANNATNGDVRRSTTNAV